MCSSRPFRAMFPGASPDDAAAKLDRHVYDELAMLHEAEGGVPKAAHHRRLGARMRESSPP